MCSQAKYFEITFLRSLLWQARVNLHSVERSILEHLFRLPWTETFHSRIIHLRKMSVSFLRIRPWLLPLIVDSRIKG